MPITPKILLTLLGIILVVVWVYNYKFTEGFNVPSNTSASTDIAGSTSSDPTQSKAQANDIQSLQELINNYTLLRQKIYPPQTNLSEQQKTKMQFMESNMPRLQTELVAALENPDSSTVTQADILYVSDIYNEMIHDLRNARQNVVEIRHVTQSNPVPTTVANNPNVITLTELKNLMTRINEEVTRLSNLRSNSPTMIARINQLTKLSADIRDMISAIERNTLKLEDVPVRPDTAEAFLSALEKNDALPTLVSPEGPLTDSLKATPMASLLESSNGMPPNVQSLLEHAKYLKWNVNLKLEYDPKLAAQDRLMARLEEMERRLTNLAISETPIPPQVYQMYLQELQVLQMSLVPKGNAQVHSGTPLDPLYVTYSRNGVDQENPYVRNNEIQFSRPDSPSYEQMKAAQGSGQGPNGKFPNGEISSDVYIRPGFVMTDDTIARRASASAFDPAAVGGFDYKKRVQEICNQIRSGNIGEPDNFGCVANPDAVSSNYSWKGNYQMVCNRLGDTWGGWYPEMFGCPKYDPTAKFKGTML